MSEETKAAHINGRYQLVGVVLTAALTFLCGLPIGSLIAETKGTAEVDKNSQEYDDEVADITSKYDDLLTSNEELQKNFDALELNHNDLLQKYSSFENDYNDLLQKYDTLEKSYNALQQKYNQLEDGKDTPADPNDSDPRTSQLLSNLVPVSGTTGNDQYRLWDVSAQDNYGNKYSSGILMRQSYSNKAHLVYALDAKYEKLTGKFVLEKGSKNTSGHYTLCAYSLVGGNKTLLDKSEVLTTATRPIDVEFNVTGVMDLVIEVYDPNRSSNHAWTAFVDAKLE